MRPNSAWNLNPGSFLNFPDGGTSPERYRLLRGKIITLMILITVAPLSFVSFIIYRNHKSNLAKAAERPLLDLTDRGKHTVDLFFKEHVTAINLIAALYSFEELSHADDLNQIFHVLKQEVDGLVNIGIVDVSGRPVNYAGPYYVSDKSYIDEKWFQETVDRNV